MLLVGNDQCVINGVGSVDLVGSLHGLRSLRCSVRFVDKSIPQLLVYCQAFGINSFE